MYYTSPLTPAVKLMILACGALMLCQCTYKQVTFDHKKEIRRDVYGLSLFGMGEQESLSKEPEK